MSKIGTASTDRTLYYKITEHTKSRIGQGLAKRSDHHALKGHTPYRRYTYSEIKIIHNVKLL